MRNASRSPHHPALTAHRAKAYRFEHRGHIKHETAMVPTLTLNNGVKMPALGFGVFQTPPEETTAAVTTALEVGYRHIDTAAAYGNERGVGNAVSRSDLDRAEVFLETKIWITD
jgi:diketogulonate reductase-like aldo/keto reductase